MSDRKQALTDLLTKVEAGEEDVHSFARVFPVATKRNDFLHDAYQGSLDAARALHEAVLPEWDWSLTRNAANVYLVERPHDGNIHSATADCPALAWLIAILKALIAMEGEK